MLMILFVLLRKKRKYDFTNLHVKNIKNDNISIFFEFRS